MFFITICRFINIYIYIDIGFCQFHWNFPRGKGVKVQNPTKGSQPVPLFQLGEGDICGFLGIFYGVGLQVTIPFHTEITQGIQKNQCQGTIYLVLLMEAEILHQVLRSKVLKNLRWLFGISEASTP